MEKAYQSELNELMAKYKTLQAGIMHIINFLNRIRGI